MSIWRENPEKTKHHNHNEFRNIKIEDLNLSVRSFNSLKRAGCCSVGDILDVMEDEGAGLRRIRNLGARSEAEIKEKLEQLRAEYSSRSCGKRTHTERPAQAGESVNTDSSSEEIDQPYMEVEIIGPRIVLRPARLLWDREIGEFHLSHYAEDRLKNCGVRKVRDLYATHPKSEPGWYAVRELFRKISEYEM